MVGVGSATVLMGTMHGHTTMGGMMDTMLGYMPDTITIITIPIIHSIMDIAMPPESVVAEIIVEQDLECIIIPIILIILATTHLETRT